MVRKTRLMKQVESRYHKPLEKLLPELYNKRGLPGMSAELGISKGTVWYWMLRFGVNVRRIAVGPGEELEVHHVSRN